MTGEIEGFVLAGGKSSRMGADKAFLKIGGESFLNLAVQNLQSICGNKIKIVLNKNQKHFIEKFDSPIAHIFDEFENRGAPAGIHAALKNSLSELTFILAVDMPFVSHFIIEQLAQTAIASEDFSAFVPIQNNGRIQPLCAVYRTKSCLGRIENLLSENEFCSVRNFLDNLRVRFFNLSESSSDEDFLLNINNPQDYENLIKAKA